MKSLEHLNEHKGKRNSSGHQSQKKFVAHCERIPSLVFE